MLPAIAAVPGLNTEERAHILDQLFETCTQLHTLSASTLREKEFASYDELIAAIGHQLKALLTSTLTSDSELLDAILSAHPRLGERKKETLSEQSKAEQAQLQSGDVGEAEKLRGLNREYEKTFLGLRYVYVTFMRPCTMQAIAAEASLALPFRASDMPVLGLCQPGSVFCPVQLLQFDWIARQSAFRIGSSNPTHHISVGEKDENLEGLTNYLVSKPDIQDGVSQE
jgi:2-oxo-4-hydroxy-4-carboxy--5-ureidoimidazoline (OHCU) decarboxylase